MEYRTLDITLQSATDLNKVNLISKMDVYAVVSISGGDKKSKQKTKTPVDHDGDVNPKWNHTMSFAVDEAALQMNRLTLDFKLVCQRALGDKDIGEVHVPMKELIDSPIKAGADAKKFVSYQVRKPSGKPKGQLSFSYQFSEKNFGAASASAPQLGSAIPPAPYPGKADMEPVTAYPAAPNSGYPPPGAYPPPAGLYPPPHTGYPTPSYAPSSSDKPPQPAAGYGYPQPPPPAGYGYPPPPPPGYGYGQQPGYGYPPPPVRPAKKNKFGMGLGAGLLGGALGGLLVGDIISDGGDFGGGCGGGGCGGGGCGGG